VPAGSGMVLEDWGRRVGRSERGGSRREEEGGGEEQHGADLVAAVTNL
jgi:hypothetical protein